MQKFGDETHAIERWKLAGSGMKATVFSFFFLCIDTLGILQAYLGVMASGVKCLWPLGLLLACYLGLTHRFVLEDGGNE
jgi:hypothetical protein